MDGKSMNLPEEKLKQLQAILPEAFSEGKVDWEKLRAAMGEDVNFSNERYVLNWAGKSDAFHVLQTPSTGTLIPVKNESVHFEETGHVFIEGENLEVLKIMQKSYFGKVKMIYIDPPYNTGNDCFIYPDRFAESTEEYQKRVGDKDEDGYMSREGLFRKNSKENGQYHSNWLNMMYPRLFLAKNLLRQDGVIFVSIDDNEVHNLRLLMNEVFGDENFVAQIIWERSFSPVNLKRHFSESHDYVLCYSKNFDLLKCNGLVRTNDNENRYKNPDNDPRGLWASSDMTVGPVVSEKVYEITTPNGNKILPTNGRCWLFTRERFEEMLADNRIWFGETGNNIPRVKKFLTEVKQGITPMTIWKYTEVGHSQDAAQKLKALFDGKAFFDYPKSVELIKRMLELYTENNSIILDFFAGSATTAHAVFDLNRQNRGSRKFICIQLPEPCDEKSEAYKAGYKTIADIAKERIRRVIARIEQDYAGLYRKDRIKKEENGKQKPELFDKEKNPASPETPENPVPDLGFKVFRLADSNFKQWRSDAGRDMEALQQHMMEFTDPIAPNATVENMVYELMLKSGKDINSRVEHKENYFCINSNELVLMLEKADEKTVEAVIRENPEKVIALDRLFEGNDQLKTNTALQMREAGIEFKTI